MATDISIAERILREAVEKAKGMTGVGTVYRSDDRGRDIDHLDAVVGAGSERPVIQRDGAPTRIVYELTVTIGVSIFHPGGASDSTDELVQLWIQRIKNAVMADRRFIETNSPNETLALDTNIANAMPNRPARPGDVGSAALVTFNVRYMQYADDAGKGPGISQLTE